MGFLDFIYLPDSLKFVANSQILIFSRFSLSLISLIAAEIKRCHPGETDCIVRTSNELLKMHARRGYPAASFPVVEPFHLKRVELSDGRSGSLNLKLSLRDVDVMGLSSLKFDRAV